MPSKAPTTTAQRPADKDTDLAQASVAPNTTAQEDLVKQGQRSINLVWEETQSRVAIWVVAGTMLSDFCALMALIFTRQDLTVGQTTVLSFLHMITTSVITTYLTRTNHQATGGVGPKPVQPYIGR